MQTITIQESSLNKIIKKTLSFMAKNKITIVPENYEKWFNLFIDLHFKNIDTSKLSPLELFGLFKERYAVDPYEELKEAKDVIVLDEKISVKVVKDVLESVDNSLVSVLDEMENHCQMINEGKKILEEENDKKILLKALSTITDKYEDLKKDLELQHKKIEQLSKELEETKIEASRDFLTGLFNRKKFDIMLEKLIERKKLFSLILFDVDDFKKINDTYGHEAGDIVLKKIGETLLKNLRPGTPVFRIGGEEFAIIIPELCVDRAKNIAERLRKIFEVKEIPYENHMIDIKATFGVTCYKEGDTPKTILRRADNALYIGKQRGKNVVIMM